MCGEQLVALRFGSDVRDHPRVCGEQEAGKGMKNVMEGSPPRVRGTVGGLSAEGAGARITPACAGNSFYSGYL